MNDPKTGQGMTLGQPGVSKFTLVNLRDPDQVDLGIVGIVSLEICYSGDFFLHT